MKRLIPVFVLACIFVIQIASQSTIQKPAPELRQFESSWLTADLNRDQFWFTRFSGRKLNVVPSANLAVADRSNAVNALIQTSLQPKEMKVRISGTISLLTNDPDQNRSYYFLDTFNKIGGKWQVIASSISGTPDVAESGGSERIEQDVLRLENEWGRAVATNDRLSLSKILSPAIVATLADGRVRDFQQLITAQQSENITRSSKDEMKIHAINDSLVVVTGIDTVAELDRDGKEILHADRFTHTWSKNTNGRWQCVASHVARFRSDAGQK
jgi:ketosteroid isomerase-like protein